MSIMKNLVSRISNYRIEDQSLPWLFLGICIAAFGLLIPFLGYYWDDWMTLYFMKTTSNPADFIYGPYRPLHALLDVLEFRLLGPSPLGWHILSLLLRWCSVILVWLTMRRVFPSAKEFANWVAVVFAIYPSFHQQSSALVYRQHWTTYVFFLLSLLFMLDSIRQKGSRQFALLLLSLTTMLAHLLTTEYLVGLETLRPILLWISIPTGKVSWRQKVRNVSLRWLPYLLVGLGFVVWRVFFLNLAEDPNPPVLIFNLLNNPLSTAAGLSRTAIQDLVAVLWTPWADLLSPSILAFTDKFELFSWTLVVFLIPVLLFLWSRISVKKAPKTAGDQGAGILVLGLASLLLGLATSWIVGRQVSSGLFSDRLSIPAMLGASILVALFLFTLIPNRFHRNLVLVVLVSLAIGSHFRQANSYRLNWIRQKDIAWQFHWRAPTLQPGTLVIGDGSLASYLDEYNSAFAINTWYSQTTKSDSPAYWYRSFFSGLHIASPGNFADGATVKADFPGIDFIGNTGQSIIAYYSSESPCWWFLTAADIDNKAVKPDMAAAAAYINLQPIRREVSNELQSLIDIFGPEPGSRWCKVFQQASLASQFGDWGRIRNLWSQASQMGFEPYFGTEYLPIIQAFAYTGEWDTASDLSLHAYELSPKSQSMICAEWTKLAIEFPDKTEQKSAHDLVKNSLSCSD